MHETLLLLEGLHALRRPSVAHTGGKLKNHLKKSGKFYNTSGLPYFFGVRSISPRKMSRLSLFCFCCGGRKPALFLCTFFCHLSLKVFFSMYLKKLWQMVQKWGTSCSDFFSLSLKITWVFEANGFGKQQWRVWTSLSVFICCLKDASFPLLPWSACRITENLRWVPVNLTFSYFCFGDWFLLYLVAACFMV